MIITYYLHVGLFRQEVIVNKLIESVRNYTKINIICAFYLNCNFIGDSEIKNHRQNTNVIFDK